MKKIFCIMLFILLALIPVKAANYEMKELIPLDVTTTIKGKTFLYKNISYSNNKIHIERIKNESQDSSPFTISIGLFDKDEKNIGTINLCLEDMTISSKEEIFNYEIEIDKKYLGEKNKLKDIKYYSVLGGNESCRKTGEHDFLGQKVDEIGMSKNNTLTDSAVLLINILKYIGITLVVLFILKFLFTNAYQNMDGSDTRAGYRNLNKELKRERERELRENPPKPKEIKKTKSDEVLKQEEKENTSRDNSDLHNFYK